MPDRIDRKSRWNSVVFPVLIALGVFAASALRGFIGSHREAVGIRYPDLGELRRRLLGQNRGKVKAVLGEPRTCAVRALAGGNEEVFYTWYYIFGKADRSAMAVAFVNDVVKEVEFFRADLAGAER